MNIIKTVLLLAAILMSNLIVAQKGVAFPLIKGTGLNDKAITVPTKNGKYSVVAIAFHREAEEDLKKWLNPLFDSFIKSGKESNSGFDMAEVYDVNFVFIPMIMGFKRVSDDFKKGTDKEFWQYVMDTEKTDIKALQQQLGVTDNKIPYFYVLDKDGKVIEVQSGKYSAAKLEKLEAAID